MAPLASVGYRVHRPSTAVGSDSSVVFGLSLVGFSELQGRGGAMMNRKQKRYEDILDVASRMFLEKGYERTTIQDIAEAIGVLKGSLYYYIDAKEDLLYDIIRINHENLVASMVEALETESTRTSTEQVRVFLANHIEFVLRNAEHSAAFQFEFRSLSPQRQAEIIQYRRTYGARLTHLLTTAQSNGELCANLNPGVASRALLSMFNSVLRWYRPSGDLDADDIAWQYTELAMRATATPSSESSIPQEVQL